MQQDLAALGIEMTIQSQDWNVFLEERKSGNYDFCREGCSPTSTTHQHA